MPLSVFILLVADFLCDPKRALDPDWMNLDPDPGWFSKSKTSMERLTPMYENKKKGC